MEKKIDYTLLFRVAKAYYVDNKTQQEIADMENFSRSQISRFLKRALEERIVTYSLNIPDADQIEALEAGVQEVLGLKKVVLIPSFYGADSKVSSSEMRKNLSIGAADKLPELLGDAKIIGVGWGRTIYETALHLRPQKPVRGRVFVPLIGSLGDTNPTLQINSIVDRIGESFRAKRKYFNLSASPYRENGSLEGTEEYHSLESKWKELDAAIVGIGTSEGGGSLVNEYHRNYREMIRTSGVVGDILAQYFYENGRVFRKDARYRPPALDINSLRQVETVIVLAVGQDKCLPICVAAQHGYFNTLVTDYDTAKMILKKKGESV